MNNYKIIKYNEGSEIDVRFSLEENTIWLTQKEMAKLFEKSIDNISLHIKNILRNRVVIGSVVEESSVTALDGKSYLTKLYNLEIIEAVGHRVKAKRLQSFINWVNDTFDSLKTQKMIEESNIIRFESNNVSLDVRVSPEEDTVWLTLNEMCLLFGRDKSVISRHINNIFVENELSKEQTVAKNATVQTEGNNLVKRITEYYNLDIIISVGYRVKSKNGVVFRKWATNVLKSYLLKGYALDSKRVLISKENYLQLENDVSKLKEDVKDIKEKIFVEPLKELLFEEGQYFDAYEYMSSLLETANSKVIIIDPYFDIKGLSILKKIKKDVQKVICISNHSKLSEDDVKEYQKQYGDISIIVNNKFHDRFIVIDNKITYTIGSSFNGIGNKIFLINTLQDEDITKTIIDKLYYK